MRRVRFPTTEWTWTLLLASALVVAGCWGGKEQPPANTTGTTTGTTGTETATGTADPAAATQKPFCDQWPTPKLMLVLSGDTIGYMEPCGCSATQSGGFARRADLFRQLQDDKKWPYVALDLGGSLKRSRRHDQIKFEMITEGLKTMGYSAMALGAAELRLGADNLLAYHQPDAGLAFLGANTVLFGDPAVGTPLPMKIIEQNGVKIGVTSVIGKKYRDDVLPQEVAEGDPINITEAATALAEVLPKLQAEKPDLLVLLSYCRTEETQALLEKFPAFDIALSAGGPEDPAHEPRMVGKSIMALVGTKGKHVCLIGYYPDDQQQRLRYDLVNLDQTRFKNHPSMEDLMQRFQDRLKDENLAANEKPIPTPNGAQYVGAAKCGECHTKAFAKWKNTKHAAAYESLIKGRPNYQGNWVPRQFDNECLACHVTGWHPQDVLPYDSGFKSLEETPHLAGQQCENCHGAGSVHVSLEETWKKKRGAVSSDQQTWRQKLHLDQKLAQDRVCYQCHDGDNSPKFNFEKYFKEIEHKFRD